MEAPSDQEPVSGAAAAKSFERFLATINQPAARDLVKEINVFMKNFRAQPPPTDTASHQVQAFLTFMESAFAKHPLWAGTSLEAVEEAVEGLEKYLLTKLYDVTFGQDLVDRERDATLSARMAALQFVRPEHLDMGA